MARRPRPAGWYPDPRGRAAERYWDGRAWTSRVRRDGESDPVAAPSETSALLDRPSLATRLSRPAPTPPDGAAGVETDGIDTAGVETDGIDTHGMDTHGMDTHGMEPSESASPGAPDDAPSPSTITVIGGLGAVVGAAGAVGAVVAPTGFLTYAAAGLTVLLGLFAGGGGATRGPVAALVLLGVVDALLGASLAYLGRF